MTDKKHTLISDAEEARIQKMIASDPAIPELTEADMASAKPFAEAFPKIAETMRHNVGGKGRDKEKLDLKERMAALQKEADKIGAVDPKFDQKAFFDDLHRTKTDGLSR